MFRLLCDVRPLVACIALSACQVGPAPSTDEPGDEVEVSCELAGEAAPIPMRRLTRSQLEHSIEDVLGVQVDVNVSDETLIGYPANISTGATLATARELMTAAEIAAVQAAPALVQDLNCQDCSVELVDAVGPRLFRRPLTDAERDAYVAVYTETSWTGLGAAWTLAAMLQSPNFVYQLETEEAGWLDGYSIAARLSYGLWDGPPDDLLFAAAADGSLDTLAGITEQVDRMILDPRFKRSMTVFVDHWLELKHIDDVTARPDLFALGDETRNALREQVVDLLVSAVRDGASVSELLLTSDYPHSPALDGIYGGDVIRVTNGTAAMNPERRAGLLTTAGVMAALAHADVTSPTLRGRAVLGQLLCSPPLPPPPDVIPSLPPAGEGQTTRERLEEHFDNPSCAACHESMDGVGFAFEHYDWTGAWRDTEAGHPIDATSQFTLVGKPVSINGGVDLSIVLAQESEVATCFARHWNRHTLSILEPEGDGDCLAKKMGATAQQPNGLRDALLAPLTSDWFRQANPAQVTP